MTEYFYPPQYLLRHEDSTEGIGRGAMVLGSVDVRHWWIESIVNRSVLESIEYKQKTLDGTREKWVNIHSRTKRLGDLQKQKDWPWYKRAFVIP